MNRDKVSDILVVAKIMDILNKSGADIPKSVFGFLCRKCMKGGAE